MSIEAWGDEGASAPEGYVSEDSYMEAVTAEYAARVMLAGMLDCTSNMIGSCGNVLHREQAAELCKKVEEWLDKNTPKYFAGQSWRDAMAREAAG